jgi:DNA polymerase II large subunit
MKSYFQLLNQDIERTYQIATKARALGLDPSDKPEIARADDLAARVESLVGPESVAKRIRELNTKLTREEVAFKISEEIVYGKFGKFSDDEKSAEQAIRTALAILNEGVTTSPIEGIAGVKIKINPDGGNYLAIYFASPIRAAGGTEAAQTVLVGDFVRRLLHLDRYRPSEDEVERFVEEIELYRRQVTHLQYPSVADEIRKAARNLPIEVTGEPTEQLEVSGHRDLPRIETNRLRGGAILVLNDGIISKAPKLKKIIDKIGQEGWEWLDSLRAKDKDTKGENKGSVTPNSKYLSEVIAGRPVFSYPSRAGGFRLRYGRSRNTGLAAVGLNPATMIMLDGFIAPGTQLAIERPGKGAIALPVDTIEGPIVKLTDGSVRVINTRSEALECQGKVTKIIHLGDMLVAYGEFLENNHPLMQSGYCEEWWVKEVIQSIIANYSNDILRVSELIETPEQRLQALLSEPLLTKPTVYEAIRLSRVLGIPIHPRFTYFWHNIRTSDLMFLRQWIITGSLATEEHVQTLDLLKDENGINLLERLGIPFSCIPDRIRLLEPFVILLESLSVFDDERKCVQIADPYEAIRELSGLTFRRKAPTYIGARMGRPEKSMERKMKPPVHGLFPIGLNGGKGRSINKAAEKKTINVELVRRKCLNCGEESLYHRCQKCGQDTIIIKTCTRCNMMTEGDVCPKCSGTTSSYLQKDIEIHRLLAEAMAKAGTKQKEVKGVRGLTSRTKEPELLEKAVLRAKYSLYVYKDGTTRYDATDAPLTHFMPKEANVGVNRLIELGYDTDSQGNRLQSDDQVLELKVQDIIVPQDCADYLLRASRFLDDLLTKVYHLEPFYKINSPESLVGQLVIGLAPHTSVGVIGRIVGFTRTSVCFAHPYWHAAKRRNCVVGNEEIPLIDTHDRLVVREIAELEKEDVTQFRVFSVDSNGTITKRQIRELVKLDAPKELCRILTSTGREIVVTPDHRMVVQNKDGLRYVEAKNLKVNDSLLTLSRMPPTARLDELDLIQYFGSQPEKRIIRVHGAKRAIGEAITRSGGYACFVRQKNVPLSRKSLWGYIDKDSIPLDLYIMISDELGLDIKPSLLTLTYRRNAARLPALLSLSRELGELSGLYLSDGHNRTSWEPDVTNHVYQVSWPVKERSVLRRVVRYCRLLFGRTPSVSKRKAGLYIATMSGRIYYELFRHVLGLSAKAHWKRADKSLAFSKEFQKGLLAGMVTGDGNVDKPLTIRSVDKSLLNHLALVSLNLGLFPHLGTETTATNFSEKPTTSYSMRYYSTDLLKVEDVLFGGKKNKLSRVIKTRPMRGKYQPTIGDFSIVKIRELQRLTEHNEHYVYDLVLDGENKTFVAGFGSLATYDCDGDEDSITLALDAILNFSRSFLPSRRGGMMDAPLVVTSTIDPEEVDDEAHSLDVTSSYPLEFYQKTLEGADPKQVEGLVETVHGRLGKPEQYEGFHFSHPTYGIAGGPRRSSYVLQRTTQAKINAQLGLAKKICAVDASDVAARVLQTHLIPDLLGCLRAFTSQKFRCVECNTRYRRVPLVGHCLKCGGRILTTVSKNTVTKYFQLAKEMIRDYDVGKVFEERIEMIEQNLASVFEGKNTVQKRLTEFG